MWKQISTLLLCVLLAASPSAAATQRGGKRETKKSEKGKGVMSKKGKKGKMPVAPDYFQKAVEAVGGNDALAALEAFSISSTGSAWIEFESHSPDLRAAASTYERAHTIVGDQARIDDQWTTLFENFQFFPPGQLTRTMVGKVGNIVGSGPFVQAGLAASNTVGSMKQLQTLFNPQLLLKMALNNPDMIVGTGNPVELAFAPANVFLYVDDADGSIAKLTVMHASPLIRDTSMTIEFEAWELEGGGVKFPVTVVVSSENGNIVWEDTRFEVIADPILDDDFFALPEGVELSFDEASYNFGLNTFLNQETSLQAGFILPPNAVSEPPQELTPGVSWFSFLANTLIIEHREGVILVEAPLSANYGQFLVDTVQSIFPDKTITHLITSHHHVDHASGCRSVLASTSAAFVVGFGVKDFWQAVLLAESNIVELETAPSTTIMEVPEADGSIVLVDEDNMVVTVLHTTLDPHADDMVLVTIETNGIMILYEADLYNAGFGFTAVTGGQVALFEIMFERGIIDESCASAVPLTIVPAHGFPQSLEASIAELASLGVDVGCGGMS